MHMDREQESFAITRRSLAAGLAIAAVASPALASPAHEGGYPDEALFAAVPHIRALLARSKAALDAYGEAEQQAWAKRDSSALSADLEAAIAAQEIADHELREALENFASIPAITIEGFKCKARLVEDQYETEIVDSIVADLLAIGDKMEGHADA